MMIVASAGGRRLNGGGFTLIEVVIALALLTIALLGVASAVALQSGGIAVSLPIGQAAVTRGHHVSVATFLAQERLEQVRRLQYRTGPPAIEMEEDPLWSSIRL